MANIWRIAGAVAATMTFGFSAQASAQVAAPISPAAHATAATPMTLLEMNAPAAASVAPAALARVAVVPARTAPAVTLASASLNNSPLLRGRPDRAGETMTDATPAAIPAFPAPGAAPSGRSLEDLVAQNASADTPDAEFECLARTVYFESRGEPIEGQLAVAEVVLNRTRSGRYSNIICEVVRQPAQFSFVRAGVIPDVPRDSAAWRRSVGVAHVAMQRLAAVTGTDSLFFHATYVRPTWGRVRPRIAQIGNHIFYR